MRRGRRHVPAHEVVVADALVVGTRQKHRVGDVTSMKVGQLGNLGVAPRAALALLGRGSTWVPHEIIGDQLPAALEGVEQSDRSVRTRSARGGVHLDHRAGAYEPRRSLHPRACGPSGPAAHRARRRPRSTASTTTGTFTMSDGSGRLNPGRCSVTASMRRCLLVLAFGSCQLLRAVNLRMHEPAGMPTGPLASGAHCCGGQRVRSRGFSLRPQMRSS